VGSRTYGNWLVIRGFLVNGDPKPSVENIKKHLRIYPLAEAANPPETKFSNISGKAVNTIHANTAEFYEEVNAIIQEEPTDALDPELTGQLAAIGIQKGKPFQPDERMRKILEEAAAIGSATARVLMFSPPRNKEYFYYSGSNWFMPFPGGSYEFLDNGARTLDDRSSFFYGATGITPAMAIEMVGVGSQYAASAQDAQGEYLDGSKNYKLRLPANVPVKDFWSVVVYDPQTRSMLQTDNPFPSLNSARGVKQNADGSADIYFGPKAPKGKEGNWIQTVPGKGWFVILRLYGPLEPWFDKSWRPGEIELVK